jgi:hypothetical protein
MTTHTTKDGRKLPISEMDNEHLLSTVRRQKRRAKAGVQVVSGGCGFGSAGNEYYGDAEMLYGRNALELFNHQDYLDEVKKRGLTI